MSQKIIDEMDRIAAKRTPMIDAAGKFTCNIFSRRDVLRRKRWYFNIAARNGEIVAQSEAYVCKEYCIHAVDRLRMNLANSIVVVEP